MQNLIQKSVGKIFWMAVVVGCLLWWPSLQPIQADQPQKFTRGALIVFEGEINHRSERYFQRKLAAAKAAGADLVVIEINSPGGTLEASLQIAETLRDVDWAYTVASIPEKALSGAALASLGCREILMRKTARIGDAGVIFLDEDFFFKYAPEKVRTDLIRRSRDLAEINGRPPELAEAMIDQNAVVYERKNPAAGQPRYRIKYVSSKPDENEDPRNAIDPWQPDPEEWTMVEEAGPTKFLDVSGRRAVELGLADANVESREQLSDRFGLEEDWLIYKYGMVDTAVYWLNLPVITGLIFVIGLIALYFELSAPGISIGGLIAGLCFTLFFWSRFLGGTAGWLELVLFLSGIMFLLVELFVIPGFGVAGVSGLALMLVSVIMASQTFVIPRNSLELAVTTRSALVLLVSGVVFVGIAAILSRHLGSIPVFKRLVLKPPPADVPHSGTKTESDKTDKPALSPHPLVSIGDWGVAESVLRPAGKARFGDHTVDCVAEGDFIEPDQQVKVTQISGNRVVVTRVDD